MHGVSLWNHEEEKSALHTVLPGILITVMRKVTNTNEGLFLCLWPLHVRSQALWEGLALLLISSPGQYYFFSFIFFDRISFAMQFFLKKKYCVCMWSVCIFAFLWMVVTRVFHGIPVEVGGQCHMSVLPFYLKMGALVHCVWRVLG